MATISNPDNVRTSDKLKIDTVYTREDLKSIFDITDATINTGVFRPKGSSSVWLFVTEEKTADRTQYRDSIEGDTLFWQGQTSGRTDPWIIEHRSRGLELLIFFRKRKYEHAGAGFRYMGPFYYASHSGNFPTSFILKQQRTHTPLIKSDQADGNAFDPSDIQDARMRISRTIAQRRGQKEFRNALLSAYSSRCAITGCTITDILEAAHIYPYRGPDTNTVNNGLLLRSDIHTLFDCGLIAVDTTTMTLVTAEQLRGSEYESLEGQQLRLPQNSEAKPSSKALDLHRTGANL